MSDRIASRSLPLPFDAAPARVVVAKSSGELRVFGAYGDPRMAERIAAHLNLYGAIAHVEPPAPRNEVR